MDVSKNGGYVRKIRYGQGNLLVGVLPSLRQKSSVYMYAFEFSPSTSLYPLIAPLFASRIMQFFYYAIYYSSFAVDHTVVQNDTVFYFCVSYFAVAFD